MKVFGISVPLVVVGAAALMFLSFTTSSTSTFSNAMFTDHQDIGTMAASRKLKDNNYGTHTEKMKRDGGNVNLEDYGSIDPSPSSKAIESGPIEHGTPLMPYIPNPGPPSPPSSSDYP
ncbi:uncharacterized protein LOC122074047 [Macadamia integrifolia]|uniref:uncharacterized protein LOC122074047 n=1 Tax=Macadamia integrifolia TaxID=60698 RepID=UPI001C4E3379|nr:uncharacterized protein LOC122074047 [Macadamia integrifolia]